MDNLRNYPLQVHLQNNYEGGTGRHTKNLAIAFEIYSKLNLPQLKIYCMDQSHWAKRKCESNSISTN